MDADEPITSSHWRDTRADYFPDDRFLRSWDFEVVQRIPGKPALWRLGKHGKLFTVEEAVAEIQDRAQEKGKVSKKHHG
jgi:hypothetical protein